MKDNFSQDSVNYARYRPTYPEDLFLYLVDLVREREIAWDCATGNGQFAAALAPFFRRIEATDISRQQMAEAPRVQNIFYSIVPAEKTDFPPNHFDLITVAQAVHWFDFPQFYKEVDRCLKPGGIVCITGYGLLRANPATNKIIDHFYQENIGPYWDPERKYLDEAYTTIPFPFEEFETPKFTLNYTWTIDHLLGYLRTWSAVKHFQKKHNYDPVGEIAASLKQGFGAAGEITFPLFLRVGKK